MNLNVQLMIEHPLIVTCFAVMLLAAIAAGGFFVAIRKFPTHPIAVPAVNSAVSIAIAIILSVSINQLWAAKRDRDQRVWSASQQHLQRLQAVLRAEGDRLSGVGKTLTSSGYVSSTPSDSLHAFWLEDTLSDDVGVHFPDYFRVREDFLRSIPEHDAKYERLVTHAVRELRLPADAEGMRSQIVDSVIDHCLNNGPGISFTESPGGFTFNWAHGGKSGSGEEVTAYRAAANAYKALKLSAELSDSCRQTRDDAVRLATEAFRLARLARKSAEQTALHGECSYLPIDR
jgi:hypothetical protein